MRTIVSTFLGCLLALPAWPLQRCEHAYASVPQCSLLSPAPCSQPWARSTRPGMTLVPGPGRKLLLRLPKRHEIRSPAVLLTGKEAEFNQAGLFSTRECAPYLPPSLTAHGQGGAL